MGEDVLTASDSVLRRAVGMPVTATGHFAMQRLAQRALHLDVQKTEPAAERGR